MIFLTGCAITSSSHVDVCPKYPIAGPKVADELAVACLPETKCPAIWNWLAEIKVLKTQLDACHKE